MKLLERYYANEEGTLNKAELEKDSKEFLLQAQIRVHLERENLDYFSGRKNILDIQVPPKNFLAQSEKTIRELNFSQEKIEAHQFQCIEKY